VQDNEDDDEFIDFVESLDVGEEAAWGMPEGWGQASFDIVRLPDDDEWLHNPLTVWRIENEKGEGPYSAGATSGAGPASSVPERDFPTGSDPDWFKKHRGWRFGYRTKQDAIEWFGLRRLEMLARKGYHLVQKPASIYEPSTTGRQVIYLPEEVELSQKEQVKQLGEQVFEAATREGYERRAAGSMKLWAMAYATEGDPERWPADRGLLRRYMTDLRTYARPGDTSWRQAWDRFEAGLPAQARRSMKARRR
jgi:hypothetical protein